MERDVRTFGSNQTMSQLPIDASSSVVALLLVGFYATSRFNMPPAARSQTSRFQYVGSCVCYVLSSAGLFILLTCLLIKNDRGGVETDARWRIGAGRAGGHRAGRR